MSDRTLKRKSIIFVASSESFFLSHRQELAIAARNAGYDVSIALPSQADKNLFTDMGLTLQRFDLDRRSKNPAMELRSLISLFQLLRKEQPDVVHLITAKPIFYGGVSARILRIPTLAALTGMGYIFTHDTLKTRILRLIVGGFYRAALNHPRAHALFQNRDDLGIATRAGFVRRATTSLIGGSGTDLVKITPAPLPDGPPVVGMPARMLRDKGVVEFVEAARLLKAKGSPATFRLIGDPDPNNPTSLSRAELEQWVADGVVEWQPHTADINAALAQVHIVALPSYREGFPKTLIDAAAAGRAAVATDVPGCRDAIQEGVTGYLCQVRSAESLAATLEKLLSDREAIARMGQAARAHAEAHFDIKQVEKAHLAIYADLARRR
jgi:glycosyltransferase involved in cell wall biosynthesis